MADENLLIEGWEDDEYKAFVEKFKGKKTTDDCYTPAPVYDAVADWVSAEYGVDRSAFLRPFWPGGDYEHAEYPEGCTVVDNPPFSILTQIVRFYTHTPGPFFPVRPSADAVRRQDLRHMLPALRRHRHLRERREGPDQLRHEP